MEGFLEGVRILDLTRMLAGPYATMILADSGAEVIKIEEPGSGDEIRRMGPPFIKGESAYFIAINRNKKSLTLDLKNEKGLEVFYKLVAKSGAVIDNFRPGVLKRLKCDYETLSRCNPKIISCSITSFGQEGPLKDLPAFDLIIQAYSGAMSLTGEEGQPPVRMGIPLGDLAGGIHAAFAVASALHYRDKTQKGLHIKINLLDCIVSMLTYVAQYYFADGKIPKPQGSKHMSCVPYGAYKTKDMYIVVGVFTEKFWEGFCKAIGQEQLVKDPRFNSNENRVKNRSILESMLEKIFLTKNADDWLRNLQAEGVPCAPVNTVDKAILTASKNMIVNLKHPLAGGVETLGYPLQIDQFTNQTFKPSPLLGEHTEEILKQILKMSDPEIKSLRDEEVI